MCQKRVMYVKRDLHLSKEREIEQCAPVTTTSQAIWSIGAAHMSKKIYVRKKETYIDGKETCKWNEQKDLCA